MATEGRNYLSEININVFSPQKRLGLQHHRSNTNSLSMFEQPLASVESKSREEEQEDRAYSGLSIGHSRDKQLLTVGEFQRNLVTPGQSIAREGEYLKGHGSFHHNQQLVASVAGIVEKVDKLVSVKALHSRYHGEIGDIVVGRITQVAAKRWKVDVNARSDYILMLTAINLPGGIQRRRTSSDELQMRNLFVENDLVYAEVQSINQDGSVALHTRNQRYGKLQNGQMIRVPCSLIKRGKLHFHSLPCGVDVILGVNGYIWLADTAQQQLQRQLIQAHESASTTSEQTASSLLLNANNVKIVGRESRERIARVRNAIEILHRHFMMIHPRSIMEVYKFSEKMSLAPFDMLNPSKAKQIITAVHTNLNNNNGNDDDNDDYNEDEMMNE